MRSSLEEEEGLIQIVLQVGSDRCLSVDAQHVQIVLLLKNKLILVFFCSSLCRISIKRILYAFFEKMIQVEVM